MATNEEYRITKITDLLLVPVHRREAMLADLREWMLMHDAMRGVPGVELSDVFRWVDDGVVGLRKLNITLDMTR